MGSGRGPAPRQSWLWGRIVGGAADPAMTRYRRSQLRSPAMEVAITSSDATIGLVTGAPDGEVSPDQVDHGLNYLQVSEVVHTTTVRAQRPGEAGGVIGVAQMVQFHTFGYGPHLLGPDHAVGQCFFPGFGFDSPVAVFFDAPGPRPALVVASAGCFDQFRECPVSHGVTVVPGSHGR